MTFPKRAFHKGVFSNVPTVGRTFCQTRLREGGRFATRAYGGPDRRFFKRPYGGPGRFNSTGMPAIIKYTASASAARR